LLDPVRGDSGVQRFLAELKQSWEGARARYRNDGTAGYS
jgi:hypothetical protein